MKQPRLVSELLVIVLLLLGLRPGLAAPAGTVFTYQGRLHDGSQPASGTYDLRFSLQDASEGGSTVGPILTNESVAVTDALFTVSLDFGAAAIAGETRWLEIGVRTNGGNDAFSILRPRQRLTASPYAVFAAEVANGSITREKLDRGAVDTSALAPEVVTSLGLLASNHMREVVGTMHGSNTLFVSMRGNDTTAQRGRPDLPFASLSNAVQAAQAGDLILVQAGRYENHAQGTAWEMGDVPAIPVLNKTNLIIQGAGAAVTTLSGTNNGHMLCIRDSSNIVVRGLRFEGLRWPDPSLLPGSSYAHVTIAHSEWVTVEECAFVHGSSFGLLEDGNQWVSTNQIVVRRCYFEDFGSWVGPCCGEDRFDGAGIAAGGWLIEQCDFVDCARGIEPYAVAGRAPLVTIRNCRFHGLIEFGVGNGAAGSFDAQIIENNIFYQAPGYTRAGSNSHAVAIISEVPCNVRIVGNTVIGLPGGIWVAPIGPATNIVVEGNQIQGCTSFGLMVTGRETRPIRHLRMANNSVSSIGGLGLEFTWVSGATIVANCFTDCRIDGGLAVIESRGHNSGVHFQENMLLQTGRGQASAAIYLQDSDCGIGWRRNVVEGMAVCLGVPPLTEEYAPVLTNHVVLKAEGGVVWGSGLELSQGGTSKALAVSSSNSPAALILGVEGRGE